MKKYTFETKYSGDKKVKMNRYFSKIFIINLEDKVKRFKKVVKQFHRKGIKYNRFIAIDGRAEEKNHRKKVKELSLQYKVKIKNLIPQAASLVIGTMQILKQQIKNRWRRVLIFEDDVVFDRKILQKFDQGVKELPNNWDLLYLGCGDICGYKGLSRFRTYENKHPSSLALVAKKKPFYLKYKNDLRKVPNKEDIKDMEYSDNISMALFPNGGWAYAYSLKGARKTLRIINNIIDEHMDSILPRAIEEGKLIAYSFDPPIVWHEYGMYRPDTDIPWTVQ